MDEDGEEVPDGWPEGFGPGPRVGMRPGYSVIEATGWYTYVSNNPALYVNPTGMADWDSVAIGALHVIGGKYTIAAGAAIVIGSGGTVALSGGTATPLAVAGVVVGGVVSMNGLVEVTAGIAMITAGLVLEPGESNYHEVIPTSMTQMIGFVVDEFAEAITGIKTDTFEKIGKTIGSFSLSLSDVVISSLKEPHVADAPTLDSLDQEQLLLSEEIE